MSLKEYLRLTKTKVSLISLAHGINDTYAGFLPTFIPFIREKLGLSYALAGNFNLIVGIFHIICQPVIGYFCDRIRRPYPMMLGPILCGLGAAMIPNGASYAAALLFAGLWGFGSALYHPQGAGGIGYVSGPEQLRHSLTWYNITGTIGSALSPLIAVAAVKTLGYRGLPVVVFPALVIAALIYFSMPLLRTEAALKEKRKGFFKSIVPLFALLSPIWGIATLRDLLFQGIRFFLPIKIAAQGGELETVGVIVFCLTIASTFGMIAMEKIAARGSGKKLIGKSLLLGSGILFMAAFSTGFFSITLYILGLSCVYSTLPLTAVMAQKLAPNDRSAASTIVMGLAWGVSNILISPVGKFADMFGIDAALILLALIPLAGMPLLLTPPFNNVE